MKYRYKVEFWYWTGRPRLTIEPVYRQRGQSALRATAQKMRGKPACTLVLYRRTDGDQWQECERVESRELAL